MSDLKLIGGKIITPSGIVDGGSLLIRDGKIAEVSAGNIDVPDAVVIHAGGRYVSPGFIDLHVHGGGGHDFMDNTTDAFLGAASLHARHGTTALFPTTLSCEKADLIETLDVYREARRLNSSGAALMGIHIEGPYFAMEQRGAQDPRFIRPPDRAEYMEILARSPDIRRWSAAPELPGALDFGRTMRSHGVLPAIAHTNAVYEEVRAAFEAGFTLVTHLYSAMSGVTRKNAFRYAGVIESAFLLDGLDVEIIADGVHLPPPLLSLVYKIKGPDRIALITDAMRGAGMPPGQSLLGGLKSGTSVLIEDGVAKLPDRSAFAGSVATANRLVRNMVDLAGVPLPEAVRMATATPARIMGLATKGVISAGMDADLALFDENIEVSMTILNGEILYDADHASA